MVDKLTNTTTGVKPRGQTTRRIFEGEAYRRIVTGDAPETLSEFAAQLSAWFKNTYPAAPDVPISFVEEAIRGTWHRRHEVIGSEL